MAEMTDWERLTKMYEENLKTKREAEAKTEQERASAATAHEEQVKDWTANTDELFIWCKETFEHCKLPESGHDIGVSCEKSSCGMFPAVSGEVKHVALNIQHDGEVTSFFEGPIPLLVAHFSDGKYHVHHNGGHDELASLQETKERLAQLVAGIDNDYLGDLFAKFRTLFGARRR
ncbi:MAG TPA: hypothetical protein VGG61_12770 [Gemmataceae bacterium]